MAILGASSASPVTETDAASLNGQPALRWQQAAIAAIVPQTPRVKSFYFAAAHPFSFRAGQHVDVRLTAPDGYLAERSYSIASAPETAEVIELAIERLDDGEVSPFFHEVAAVGDEIELRGPIGGHFVWDIEDGGPLLLLGGGSGVVPLMSMIRHRAAQGSSVPALLLYSARNWDEIIFRDELIALHDRRDGFELVFASTREPARRSQDFGRRVDTAILTELLTRLPQTPKQVFICGANPFVEAASQGAIEAGVAAHIIRTERYGG
jgi:ferredoxin-NADP reductase